MQVNPFSAAAQAASIAAQSTSSDKGSRETANATTGVNATDAQIENSGSADSDRDAQGQGDGLGDRGKRKMKEQTPESPEHRLPAGLTDDDSGGLDIVG